MEIQSSVLYTMPKNSSTSENYSPTQRQSLHRLQPQSEQHDIHSRFQQSQNQLHKQQNNETQKHDELYKIIEHSNTSSRYPTIFMSYLV